MNITSTFPGANVEYNVTEDIKPQWLNVIRRLQSACHGNQGLAVLSVRVLVDASGEPLCWTAPLLTKLEPKSSADTLLMLTEQT